MSDIVSIFYPENMAGGFSRCDGTVQFYQRVRALLRPGWVVLDFGAVRCPALKLLDERGHAAFQLDHGLVVELSPW